MPDRLSQNCTAFVGDDLLVSGSLVEVVIAIMIRPTNAELVQPIVFDDASGAVIDLDLRGSPAEAIRRLTSEGGREIDAPKSPASLNSEPRGRGRPKLGVVPREVTLLPRQWEWLAAQPGNVSQTLRRLVDEARRADRGQSERAARERAYRFLAAQAGNLPDYEEVIRALFVGDAEAFADLMAAWPTDIRDYAIRLAKADLGGDTQ